MKRKDKTKNQKKDNSITEHNVNGLVVEQRIADGFINGTAMCVAYGKEIKHWFGNQSTIDLILALAEDLGLKSKGRISDDSGISIVSDVYPELVLTKRGSPANGGGTWLHPDLAMQLAQWCNPVFAIQVSRWVREWIILLEKKKQAEIEKLNELKAIKACVLPEAKKWEAQFPPEFWEKLKLITGKSQPACSWLTQYIYSRFPKGVHKTITSQNPRNDNGNRKYKTHQFLTTDVGISALELYRAQFIAVMDISPVGNYSLFVKRLKQVFSSTLQLELPLLDELENLDDMQWQQ